MIHRVEPGQGWVAVLKFFFYWKKNSQQIFFPLFFDPKPPEIFSIYRGVFGFLRKGGFFFSTVRAVPRPFRQGVSGSCKWGVGGPKKGEVLKFRERRIARRSKKRPPMPWLPKGVAQSDERILPASAQRLCDSCSGGIRACENSPELAKPNQKS